MTRKANKKFLLQTIHCSQTEHRTNYSFFEVDFEIIVTSCKVDNGQSVVLRHNYHVVAGLTQHWLGHFIFGRLRDFEHRSCIISQFCVVNVFEISKTESQRKNLQNAHFD